MRSQPVGYLVKKLIGPKVTAMEVKEHKQVDFSQWWSSSMQGSLSTGLPCLVFSFGVFCVNLNQTHSISKCGEQRSPSEDRFKYVESLLIS